MGRWAEDRQGVLDTDTPTPRDPTTPTSASARDGSSGRGAGRRASGFPRWLAEKARGAGLPGAQMEARGSAEPARPEHPNPPREDLRKSEDRAQSDFGRPQRVSAHHVHENFAILTSHTGHLT